MKDWSPDGKLIAYATWKQAGAPEETWIIPLADPSKSYPFLRSGFFLQGGARFSPDGKYLPMSRRNLADRRHTSCRFQVREASHRFPWGVGLGRGGGAMEKRFTSSHPTQ